MESLTTNITGKVRRELLQGQQYLVAPLTMIVPGVLQGSRGALYYPLEEIRKNPQAWNGIPITLGHPTKNGQAVSARTPEILNSHSLGIVLRAVANEELVAEGWFNVERTNALAPGLLERIENGQKIELSTGLGVRQEIANGEHKGRDYVAIARDHQPDHLAILLDVPGACSVSDGCGVNNEDDLGTVENAELPPNAKLDEPFRTPDGPRKFAVYVKDGDKVKIVRFGDPDMEIKRDDDERRKSFRARHQCDTNPGPKTKPKYWSCKFWEAGSTVSELLNERYEMTKEEIKNMLDKKVKGTVKNVKGKMVTYERNGKMYKASYMEKDGDIEMGDEEEMDEKVDNAKAEIVNDLIANCECWEEADRSALEGMSLNKLEKLAAQSKRVRETQAQEVSAVETQPEKQVAAAVENSATDWLASAPDSIKQIFNEMQATIENRRKSLVSEIVANKHNPFTTDELNAKQTSELEKLAAFAKNTLPTSPEAGSRSPVYVGAGVANTATKTADAAPSLLTIPTLNWQELSDSRKN